MTYDCIHPGVFQARPNRFIAMVELDGETLEQFCNPPLPRPRTPWQCRMTIEI